ncbi:MAG: multifunctional CCA addition/repair protein [Gammaproteobacteria bacterium]|nr:MAG: multifunctional CCA addition/repair protein [Gammaproteobacteria bacterium]
MKAYLVGGAVRDRLLGLPVKDRDWVVTGATPEDMLRAGYTQVGADFPVFLHPETGEEYALARTERKSGRGYTGFICDFSPDIRLEDDLMRRDLTINALAQDENGKIIDPSGGLKDLEARILRHVSPAFVEDPLRVLRVARFAARFASLGFTIADETLQLMHDMAASGELDTLTPERVWQETDRALSERSPQVYFRTLRQCGALKVTFPELDALFGVPQTEKYHPEIDTGEHALLSLEQAVHLTDHTSLRWAALIHDLGKGRTPRAEWPRHIAHEVRGKAPVKALCKRLKAPRAHTDAALLACEFHTHVHRALELKPATVLKLFNACDLWRRPERLEGLLIVAEADARGRTGLEDRPYPQADYLRQLARAARDVQPAQLMAQGHEGKALGEALAQARKTAIADTMAAHPRPKPNEH